MEPRKTDEMRYYPVCLDIKGRPCLVVGGGGVGTRKVKGLLSAGAQVTVVSPELSAELQDLTPVPVRCHRRRYRPEDLDGMFLVFGATDDEALNRRISADAGQRNMLCNIADRPQMCSFILPSVVHRGDLLLAISTSGRSPAFAKRLRKDLEAQFGSEYARFLRLMGAIREQLLSAGHSPEAHKSQFETLLGEGLAELVCGGDEAGADRLLARVLGPDFQLERLLKEG
jgi:precorrin-2 dehydrogenase/sirohydrochlorin ferrochelatase